MMYKRTYNEYQVKLLQLPMQDATFIAKLSASNLLPGDTRSKIEGQSTPIDKASVILKTIIEPSIEISDTESFDKLLLVMDDSGYDHIKNLAVKIGSAIKGGEVTEADTSNSRSIKENLSPAEKFSDAVKCPKCGGNVMSCKVKDRKKITYGHPYYRCSSHFFEWKNTAGVKCHCGQNAKKDIIREEGPNNGKWFYTCKNKKCNYDLWSADVESPYGRKIYQMKGYKCRSKYKRK